LKSILHPNLHIKNLIILNFGWVKASQTNIFVVFESNCYFPIQFVHSIHAILTKQCIIWLNWPKHINECGKKRHLQETWLLDRHLCMCEKCMISLLSLCLMMERLWFVMDEIFLLHKAVLILLTSRLQSLFGIWIWEKEWMNSFFFSYKTLYSY